jgi:DNA-binding MarR family transcriptional regulator/GNAT superfamily N-acetyltransferase
MPDTESMQPLSALKDDIACFRRFNRMYTRFIGTLREGLLDTEYTLAEARVLYELANRTVPNAKQIAEELGMDAGYLSRLLGRLERGGLLKRKASRQDGRYAELSLTARGKAAFKKLNARSAAQARGMLEPLTHAARTRLIRAMSDIENILVKSADGRPSFILRDPRAGDMGWVVCREAAVYAAEYGFDRDFEALVARIVSDFIANFDPARERCWIADIDGESVGHIFLVRHSDQPDTAKLRLLFVEPSARGMGLGRALVKECILFARSAAYRRVVLWTQSNLLSARRIYIDAGFRLAHEEPHHSFGQDLIAQTWELDLV